MTAYPAALRRAIRIRTWATKPGGGRIRSAVEDDFHHFRVAITYQQGQVSSISFEALRTPFDLCASAGHRLDELIGMPLSGDTTQILEHADARLQCTHQFDLAGLAIRAAARGVSDLRYDATVEDAAADGTRIATVRRDGLTVQEWIVKDGTIIAPAAFADRTIHAGFTRWACGNLSDEDAEAALVLRRAIFITRGRGDPRLRPSHPRPDGGCWVKQPDRAAIAERVPDTQIDFSSMPERLLAGDADWFSA